MLDATQWMGWGGVSGMLTFLQLAHMLDATQWIGWDVDVLWACAHVGCYAMDGAGWVGCWHSLNLHTCWMLRMWMGWGGVSWNVNVPCTCTHVGCYAMAMGEHSCTKPLQKNGNGIPAQERHLGKVRWQNGNTKCSETHVLNKNKENTQFPSPPTICWLHEVLRLPLKYCQEFFPIGNSMISTLVGLPNKHEAL